MNHYICGFTSSGGTQASYQTRTDLAWHPNDLGSHKTIYGCFMRRVHAPGPGPCVQLACRGLAI